MVNFSKNFSALIVPVIVMGLAALHAEDFRQDSKITQVIGDVLNEPGGGAGHPAKIGPLESPCSITGADGRLIVNHTSSVTDGMGRY